MIKEILSFLRQQNPDIAIQAPSRINLINPLDAVEGDFWMPSVAINGYSNPLSAFIYIKKTSAKSKIKNFSVKEDSHKISIRMEKDELISKNILEIKNKFNGFFKLFYGSIYRFYKTCSAFWKKFLETEFEIGILTTIPRQSGLGGSSAIIIAILYGFSKFFNIFNNLNCLNKDEFPINIEIISEMATKVEDNDLKITAGYGDRYVIAKGGLLFCSYYGKLHHKELSMEPLAICDRIDKTYNIKELPLIICYSGVLHKSGNVHEKLRNLYLKKDTKIIKGYRKLAKISWKSRFLLMKQDWKHLGVFLKENSIIMNNIMKHAGFKHGIGLANNILISLIEDHPDVYAVKLTGAGGGGSVFALVEPDKIDNIKKEWQERLLEIVMNKKSFFSLFPTYPQEIREHLKNAQFFKMKISEGVKEI
jgi:galactokinase/mevalonate kinase-like predicted kinase